MAEHDGSEKCEVRYENVLEFSIEVGAQRAHSDQLSRRLQLALSDAQLLRCLGAGAQRCSFTHRHTRMLLASGLLFCTLACASLSYS